MAKLTLFRVLKIKHFVIFITFTFLISCGNRTPKLSEVVSEQIEINTSYPAVDSIEQFILPYQDRINNILDSTLAYAPYRISKEDGPYNTTAGNLMADILLSEAGPVFKKRTGKNIDFVLMNHGGIRSVISKGHVSARTAYEVMPFENSITVVSFSGASVRKLVNYVIWSKKAHPIAGIQIVLRSDGSLDHINIQGKPLDMNRYYNVATSDYLVSGGDDMVFFKDARKIFALDYKVRNAMIDHFKKVDTLLPKIDNRYYRLN
ncbi:5'-nucleotidase C-terminal domain-containing protein [Maribacter sp. 2304DJ31-5]|uniref:5'-nucleotidase C-terminal domain-containing protein n=1 Tax=Maribacter sp. 2304DJ31-5 TaxID=3386273 RepID=UPI0039BCEED0